MTFSQPTANSTDNDAARRAELVAALERAQIEVRAGRKFIDGLEKQIELKQRQIDEFERRDAKRVEIQELLQKEINELRLAIKEQKNALRIKTEEADYAKKELDKTNRKLKSARTREKFLVGAAAILGAILILK